MIDKIEYNPKLYSTPSTASRESSPSHKCSYLNRAPTGVTLTSVEFTDRSRPNSSMARSVHSSDKIFKVSLIQPVQCKPQVMSSDLNRDNLFSARTRKSPIKAYPIDKEEKL